MSHLIDSWEDSLSIFSPNVFAISHYVSHQVVPSHTVLRLNFGPKNWNLTYSKDQYFDSFLGRKFLSKFWFFFKKKKNFGFQTISFLNSVYCVTKTLTLKILSEWVESVTKFMTGRFRRCKEKRFSIGCSFWRCETLWPRVARIICIVMYHSFLYSQRKFSQDCHGIFFFHCDSCHR